MRTKIASLVIALGLALLVGPVIALAQPASQPVVDGTAVTAPTSAVVIAAVAGDPTGLFQSIFENVQHGNYAPAAVLALMLCIWFLRKYGTRIPHVGHHLDWTNTDRGGVIFAFTTSVLGGLLSAVTAGGFGAINGSVIKTSLGIGVAAIGGFTAIKRLYKPSDAVPALADEGPTKPSSPPPTPAA